MTSSTSAATAAPSLDDLSAALSRVAFGALPAEIRNRAAQRIFDSLAAAALGFATPEGRRLAAYLAASPTTPPDVWCRAHVAAARTTEVDDIDLASCTTAGAVVVPAALGAAYALGADSRRLLEAVVAGYEAMLRLGRAIGGATLVYRGVWPTYVTAAFGAAAVEARLLDLDAATTARALALALARTALPAAGLLQRSNSRYYALGCAAVDGLDSARAAAAHIDTDAAAVTTFAARLDLAIDAGALATEKAVTAGICAVDTKLWPSSRQALSSIAAFVQLRCVPDDIERIEVAVPPAYRQMIDRPAWPAQRIESLLSVQYQLAVAAIAPGRLNDALRRELTADARVAALMNKIEVYADEALGAKFPQVWGSRVEVQLRAGGAHVVEVLDPPGSGSSPLEWLTLAEKYERIFEAGGLGCAEQLVRLRRECAALASAAEGTAVTELIDAVNELRVAVERSAGGR